ncbi:MAG: aquaporin [Anaerolineales bacterium]|nr:aquaporin [Anaerolineales bacterium]
MKYVYEFIGTFFLVLTVGMVIVGPDAAPPGFAPLAIGTVFAVMIFDRGYYSGGHLNPAVSLAVAVRGKIPYSTMVIYWVAQIVAGAVAAYLVLWLKGANAEIPTVDLNAVMMQALVAEFLFTFALCFMVLNVATAKGTANNSFYGWAIGFTVLAGAYAVGTISGGAFNPAVAVGLTVMNISSWVNIWIYLVAQLLAAVVAAFVFKAANPEDK